MEWPLCACDSFAGWILHLTAVQLVFVGTINNEDCNLQGPSSVAYPKPALDPNAHGMRTCAHIHTHACAQVNTARAQPKRAHIQPCHRINSAAALQLIRWWGCCAMLVQKCSCNWRAPRSPHRCPAHCCSWFPPTTYG